MSAAERIVITGADGFFGWHLRARLLALRPEAQVRSLDPDSFADDATLATALAGATAVVHLAGVNRGTDEEVATINPALAERLTDALDRACVTPVVVYADSIHAARDTTYGSAKRAAGERLLAWGERTGAAVADLRFPNLFGECGRPNYNSAVATFCHDLVAGRPSEVNPEGSTELFHVQDAAASVLEAIDRRASGTVTLAGERVAIPELHARLRRLHDSYGQAHFPDLDDRLDLRLFNQLRAAGFPGNTPQQLTAHRDTRGMFVEVARGFGATQTSFSATAPGITRGDHFHLDKVERFVVLHGTAVIRLRRLFTDDVHEWVVRGDEPVAIDMPPLHTHNITNTGDDELLTIFWANDHFDPAAPDTFVEPVGQPTSPAVGVAP